LNSRHDTPVCRRVLVIHLCFPQPPLYSETDSKTPAFRSDLVFWLLGLAF
jgi:hypothetical protein